MRWRYRMCGGLGWKDGRLICHSSGSTKGTSGHAENAVAIVPLLMILPILRGPSVVVTDRPGDVAIEGGGSRKHRLRQQTQQHRQQQDRNEPASYPMALLSQDLQLCAFHTRVMKEFTATCQCDSLDLLKWFRDDFLYIRNNRTSAFSATRRLPMSSSGQCIASSSEHTTL